ncbi:MAG: histidine phosphatase family protein, partial [Actinomycetota bacterium]|nr:histidine phosphatase family protein [Actinomycetota bacterium]
MVRHGETAANAEGLLQGRSDRGLTERGRAQAAALARVLGLEPGSVATGAAVVSSPLRRARETAEAFGMPVRLDERWIELDYGEFEGLGAAELRTSLQRGWNDPEWAPPGGESLAAVTRRVAAACEELAAGPSAAANVIVVTHVSPIKAAAAWALGTGPEVAWRMHVDVASLTVIAVREGGVPLLT